MKNEVFLTVTLKLLCFLENFFNKKPKSFGDSVSFGSTVKVKLGTEI